MAELRTAVASGVGWTAAQKWTLRVAGVLTFVVLSRLLSPSDIGLVTLALALIGLLGVVADLGITTFLVQTETWDEGVRSTAFWTATALSLAITGLVMALAFPVAALLGQPRLGPVVVAVAPMLVAAALSAVPVAILQREFRFRELAWREMGAGLLSAVAGICLAVAGAGVWALVAQSLVQAGAGAVLVWRMSEWRPTRQVSRAAFRELCRFGGPVLGVNVMYSLRDRLEPFLLSLLVGVTALGYWSVAVRLLSLLSDVSIAVFDSVALPVFAATRLEPERFRRAFEQALASTQALVVPVLAVLAVVSPALLPLAFGEHWGPAVAPAQALCLSYGIGGLGYFNRAALLAHGRSGVEFVLTAGALVLHLAILAVGASHGLTALAFGFSGEALVVVVLGGVVLRRTLGIGLQTLRRSALMVALGSLVALLALAGVHAASLPRLPGAVLGGAFTAVAVTAALWATNAPLLRQVGRDVHQLLRRRSAVPA